MIRTLSRLTAFLFTLLLAAPSLRAQCAPPDGLDGGPCCSAALLQVPKPKFTQGSLGICWQNCNVVATQPYTARWGGLLPGLTSGGTAPCGWFRARLELFIGTALAWTGAMQVTYARTWVESPTAATTYHVWRFLVNGDLVPTTAAGPMPCPVPPCVPAHGNRARYTGYVDYALNCTTGLWSNAWMIQHACDRFDHDPAFPRGGVFHPDRTYTFVGPGAGFVPSAILPVEAGGTAFESIRDWRVPVPGTTGPVTCETEERIAQAGITPITQLCSCVNGPAQYVESALNAFGACGTMINSGTAPGGFTSAGIGTWTIPAVYPGVERLRWNVGTYQYFEPCTGVTSLEFFYGVTTAGGYPANQYLASGIGPALPLTFVDQVSSKLFPAGAPTRNVPFLSDHVLNLNLP